MTISQKFNCFVKDCEWSFEQSLFPPLFDVQNDIERQMIAHFDTTERILTNHLLTHKWWNFPFKTWLSVRKLQR